MFSSIARITANPDLPSSSSHRPCFSLLSVSYSSWFSFYVSYVLRLEKSPEISLFKKYTHNSISDARISSWFVLLYKNYYLDDLSLFTLFQKSQDSLTIPQFSPNFFLDQENHWFQCLKSKIKLREMHRLKTALTNHSIPLHYYHYSSSNNTHYNTKSSLLSLEWHRRSLLFTEGSGLLMWEQRNQWFQRLSPKIKIIPRVNSASTNHSSSNIHFYYSSFNSDTVTSSLLSLEWRGDFFVHGRIGGLRTEIATSYDLSRRT